MRSKEQRSEQLLEAARDVFADRGFHAATIEDIVVRAEVARGTFYLYFSDKRAVFEALVDRFFERVESSVTRIDISPTASASPIEQLRANLLRVTELALADPATMKILLNDAAALDPEFSAKLDAFYAALRRLLLDALEEGQRIGLIRDGDREVMSTLGIGMLKEVLLAVVTGRLDRAAPAVADEVLRVVARGLLVGR